MTVQSRMLFDSHGRDRSPTCGRRDRPVPFPAAFTACPRRRSRVPRQELLCRLRRSPGLRRGAGSVDKGPPDRWRAQPSAPGICPSSLRCSGDQGISEIAMTTNAARLDELAAPLKRAGLDRLNISLDTLDAGRAAEFARRDVLPSSCGALMPPCRGLRPPKFTPSSCAGVTMTICRPGRFRP